MTYFLLKYVCDELRLLPGLSVAEGSKEYPKTTCSKWTNSTC